MVGELEWQSPSLPHSSFDDPFNNRNAAAKAYGKQLKSPRSRVQWRLIHGIGPPATWGAAAWALATGRAILRNWIRSDSLAEIRQGGVLRKQDFAADEQDSADLMDGAATHAIAAEGECMAPSPFSRQSIAVVPDGRRLLA